MKTKQLHIPAYIRLAEDTTEDTREFDFIISSEEKDTYGTIFKADGWNFDRYQQNPVVFYQHTTHSEDPDNLIGITTKLWQEGKQTLARVKIEDAATNPKAEKIRKKLINGTLRMASIGAHVHSYRMGDKTKAEDPEVLYFDKQELFEWSIVTIGSNPDAFKRTQDTISQIRTQQKQDELPPLRDLQEGGRELQIQINKNKQ